MTCPWCSDWKPNRPQKMVVSSPYIVSHLGTAILPVATISHYVECEKCGLVYQINRQADEWYNWFYSSGTYRQTLGISQEEMDKDEQKRARNLVWWLKSLEEKIEITRHLDIGCSKGYFIDEIDKAFDCDITSGVDLYEPIHIYEVNDCVAYNLVSAIHVLEHVTDPVKELTTWAQMTSKYLLIEVPGLNTPGGALRFAHLYYFPPKLLMDKIIELGFEIMDIETEPNTRILAKRIDINKNVL